VTQCIFTIKFEIALLHDVVVDILVREAQIFCDVGGNPVIVAVFDIISKIASPGVEFPILNPGPVAVSEVNRTVIP